MKKLPLFSLLLVLSSLFVSGQPEHNSFNFPHAPSDPQKESITAISNALEFDGFEDYVAVSSGTALIAGLDEFSMCGWVYPTNANAIWPDFDGFFGIKEEGVCDFYIAQINGTGIEARITTSMGMYTINPNEISEVTVDEWHHYALVYTGEELQIYLDGELDGYVAAEGTIDITTSEITFGKLEYFENDFFLDGKLDEITFWDKALTEDDLAMVMCISGDPGAIEGLTAYYDFNEESGWELPDYFGNYNGVLIAMTGDEWVESEVCEAGFDITFTVADELTSEPVVGAEVNLEGVVKTTDDDGMTVFSNFDPGTYVYNVTHPDYYEAFGEVEIIDVDITEEVTMDPVIYYSITFIVTENPGASPVDSAIVNLDGILKYTDETGTAFFDGYLPGNYTYNVSKPGYFLVPGVAEVTDDDLILEIGLLISGLEEFDAPAVNIYPNPADQRIVIELNHPGQQIEARLLSLSGTLIRSAESGPKKCIIELDGLAKGQYLVEITIGGERVLKKVVVH